ncbi:hypothetical protein G8E10_17650 [Rhizobiaceae bacterium CRRU44]|uniref:Uncharacterized protein n=1 Tax=Ferranicluibacter rubi TaxID=2715133 RepID=A0AA43ZIK0_9HYPH|nr:hypothetical protein [Ferranicluibacter rubi]NHT77542.1 hypothetical protein [Ferranicluibacter rubi]
MAKPSPDTTPLVFRQRQDGSMRAYFNGVPIPGVTDLTINQRSEDRYARATIEVIGLGFRVELEPDDAPHRVIEEVVAE